MLDPPPNLLKIIRQHTFWMLSCALREDTPMWWGWNSMVHTDELPQQIVGYMENIDLPSTRQDVVQETLCRSQIVAQQCGEQFAIVHYDLAIAKPALKIRAQESPKYDNIFICSGTFHIAMAYFGSLGYILESSGGPQILCDSGILAPGSM